MADDVQVAASQIPVITIDGPSASGKGTVSRMLAQELGWHMLDSGALYRLVAYSAHQKDIALEDVAALAKAAAGLDVVFVAADGDAETRVMLEGDDVTLPIRSELVGNAASKVAAIPEVREALLERQRNFLQAPGLVADGRDMGTVIFPQALLKIFLSASAEERAKRRYNQLKEKGIGASLAHLFDEIAERDRRDSERSSAPLIPASDAIQLDTSNITATQAAEQIKALFLGRQQ